MKRVILDISVATLAFLLGIAANWSVNAFGGFAVDKVYNDPVVDAKVSTFMLEGHSIVRKGHCGRLIVSVTEEGALDLNGEPMGSLDDTSVLSERLTAILDERVAIHAYVDSLDLPLRLPEDRTVEKTVQIKAPRSLNYGKVVDLIATIKATGAEPIGLIAERPLPSP
jgi:biopolymer transport protein ExbD